MYKVIIADDEKRVITAIKRLGKWTSIGLEIVAEAHDGDELCELVEKIRPDIVLTDMHMPGICGSDLLRKLSNDFKKTKIIIISGFDDFEYTRQAINSKATDYILKPIDADSLNSALNKAVSDIGNEQSRAIENVILKTRLNEALPYLTERFFNNLIKGQDTNEIEFAELFGLTGENNDLFGDFRNKSNYTVAILTFCDLMQICIKDYQSNFFLFRDTISSALNELLDKKGTASFMSEKAGNEVVIVLCGYKCKESLFLIINDIREKLHTIFGMKVFIGIGTTYNLFSDIKLSFSEARIVLMQMNILEKKRIAFYDDIAFFSKNCNLYIQKCENLFLVAVENGNMALLKECIEEVYDDISNASYVNISNIRKLNKDILFLLEKLMENVEGKVEFLNELYKLRDKVEYEVNIVNIKNSMFDFIKTVSYFLIQKKNKNENAVIYKIRDYIDNNYCARVSLSDLSKIFYLSREYISKMFKLEFEQNLFDHLNSFRVEKAKQLLIEGSKVSEIVSLIGFTDESHFSKVFAKYTGLSPKIYKEKYLG